MCILNINFYIFVYEVVTVSRKKKPKAKHCSGLCEVPGTCSSTGRGFAFGFISRKARKQVDEQVERNYQDFTQWKGARAGFSQHSPKPAQFQAMGRESTGEQGVNRAGNTWPQ